MLHSHQPLSIVSSFTLRHSSYDLLPSFSIRTDLGIEISHQDLHIMTRNFIHDTLQLFVEVVFLVIFRCIRRCIYTWIIVVLKIFACSLTVNNLSLTASHPSNDLEASPLRSTPTSLSWLSPPECSTVTPFELIIPLPVHLISLIPSICKS